MTAEGVSSSHPRWSPDGKLLAFLSARNEGKTQVWLLNRQGGEAQQLTDTPQDVEDFAWSPDGRRMVLVLKDPTPEELDAAKEKSRAAQSSTASDSDPEDKKPKSKKPWVIDRLQFKVDELGYLDRRRTHLYVFDISKKSLTQVTSGDFDDSEPAWSPDSKLLAFTSNRSARDPDLNYNTDIWVVPTAVNNPNNGAPLTQVTTNPGIDMSPAWSPDGKSIAYVTMLDPKLFDYATHHLAVSPATGGPAKVLTLSLDRMVTNPHFSSDGKFIYFIADDDGTQALKTIHLESGGIADAAAVPLGLRAVLRRSHRQRLLVGSGPVNSIAAQIATIDRPNEIYIVRGQTQATHPRQRRPLRSAQALPRRIRPLQKQRRHPSLRLPLQAARLHPRQEISHSPHPPRRPRLGLLRRIFPSSPALRRQRLCRPLPQPSRLLRLWPELR